jgi:hypothetical protein
MKFVLFGNVGGDRAALTEQIEQHGGIVVKVCVCVCVCVSLCAFWCAFLCVVVHSNKADRAELCCRASRRGNERARARERVRGCLCVCLPVYLCLLTSPSRIPAGSERCDAHGVLGCGRQEEGRKHEGRPQRIFFFLLFLSQAPCFLLVSNYLCSLSLTLSGCRSFHSLFSPPAQRTLTLTPCAGAVACC